MRSACLGEAQDGVLDAGYVDALGVRVHCELQRLGEELQPGRRVAALLAPLVARVRGPGGGAVRVVDVGCGLGYVVRSLAATSALGPDVELVGVDLNPVLVAEAGRLAGQEGLSCWFVRGGAFEPRKAGSASPRSRTGISRLARGPRSARGCSTRHVCMNPSLATTESCRPGAPILR